MKEIELYDIITLEDDTEYTALKMINKNEKKYCLLAPVDEEEELDMENIKIVELIKENNETVIQDIVYGLKTEILKIIFTIKKLKLD